jgi:hypothetical protein
MDPQENIRRLEAFVAQVTATRGQLAGFLSAAEAAAEGLSDQTASVEGRLEVAGQSVGALTQSLETHHQHVLTELSALSLAGAQVNEQAVGVARTRLQEVDAGFGRGLERSRDDLHRTAEELAQVSGHAGQAAETLDGQQAGHGARLQDAGVAMRSGVLQAGDQTHTAGTEMLASMEAARNYVGEGLEGYLGSAFSVFTGEMSERAQPVLADSLGEVGRTVLRCFDDLDALVEEAANRLTEETEPILRDLTGLLEDWKAEVRRRLDGSAQEALQPYAKEIERHIETVRKGQETASDAAQLVPHLAAARHVADRIQDMLDVMNPLG